MKDKYIKYCVISNLKKSRFSGKPQICSVINVGYTERNDVGKFTTSVRKITIFSANSGIYLPYTEFFK